MSSLKGSYLHFSVVGKLITLLAITLFVTLILLPVIAIVSIANPSSVELMKLSQLLLSVGMFVVPPFVLAYLCSNNSLIFLHFDKKINWVDITLVIFFMVLIIPFVNLLGDLNHRMVLPKVFSGLETWMKVSEDQAMQFTERLLNVHSIQSLFFNIFLIAMIPALGEELFFRGALQGILQQKMNVKLVVWIVAIIFSAIHLQFYGFFPRMLLGAFFGYLLIWSENMWLPIVAHFTNNVIAVIFYYFKNNGYQLIDIDTIGVGKTLWIGCVSGVLVLIGFFYFYNRFSLKVKPN